jgi:integrase
MYTVTKCKYQKKSEQLMDGWILTHDSMYPFIPNKFLHQMNNGSPNTAKQYAYKLCKFFNYLETNWSLDYRTATTQHLNKFFTYMLYGTDNNIISLTEGNRSGFTLKSYFAVIKRFYSYLYSQNIDLKVDLTLSKTSVSKHSYLYGQYWEDKKTKLFIDNSFERGKPPIRYEKWYTEEQIEAVLSNFNTYRDKAIFSLSLDGMRIDEILSLRLHDYKSSEGIMQLFRSKGKQDGEATRICVLSEKSRSFLEEYLFNEREPVEIELIRIGITVPDNIFLNIKRRKNSFGNPVGYHNALERIKVAANKAGLDPKKIRTHSGRSTKAGELFREQAKNPMNLTDNQILEIMGWANMSSAEPYKNRQDKETAIENWKRLNELKEQRHNDDKDQ